MCTLSECTIGSVRLTVPLPEPIIIKDSVGKRVTKIHVYNGTDRIESVPSEFRKLNASGYTHSVNMPGGLSEIFYFSKRMRVVALDQRMLKWVSDFCEDLEA